MCQAIRDIGLEAEHRDIYGRSPENSDRWIFNYPFLACCYGYLRAGIPVILTALVKGVGEHAITLVGYRVEEDGPVFDDMKLWQPEPPMSLKGSRITKLYAHDDQIGPYSKLVVQPSSKTGEMEEFPLELGSDWRTYLGYPTTLVPLSVTLPLYHKIRVPFVSALRLAIRMQTLLARALDYIPIEWDIFLSSVNEYKKEISMREDVDSKIRQRILCQSYPRFFWRARAIENGNELCEMLIDATDMELSFQLFTLNIFDDYLLKMLSDMPKGIEEDLEYDKLGLGPFLLRFIGDYVSIDER